jgi:HK97 gp10 family phage protein
MPTFKVQLQGAKEFLDLLNEVGTSSGESAKEGLLMVAEAFVSDARSDAPVLTGFMVDHIEITEETQDSVKVESSAPYSGFVDAGTVYQEPQPFFTGNVERLGSAGGLVEANDEVKKYWEDLVNRLSRYPKY